MAGIHEIRRHAPQSPSRAASSVDSLAILRSQMMEFEKLVASNRRQLTELELQLTTLAGAASAADERST